MSKKQNSKKKKKLLGNKKVLGSGYLGKLDSQIISELGQYIHVQGIHQGQFIEASILEAAFVEFMLRISIFKKASRKKNFSEENMGRKYWDGQSMFAQLVDYYELLGGFASIAQELRKYNSQRNKIVHHLLEYNSVKNLLSDAKACYKQGIVVESMLRSELKFPPLQDMDHVFKL